jgi:O-methyltransferase involved in polyketide biosynthesis
MKCITRMLEWHTKPKVSLLRSHPRMRWDWGALLDSAALNFIAARPEGMTVVDIAAGFSPRGIQLANAYPDIQVIEIDLPDVVRDKQLRLKNARNITVPRNISWKSADPGVTPLSEVLDGQLVDFVVAEGLAAYFTPADNQRIAWQIRQSLRPGGKYLCDIPWEQGMKYARNATRFFSRQAGTRTR